MLTLGILGVGVSFLLVEGGSAVAIAIITVAALSRLGLGRARSERTGASTGFALAGLVAVVLFVNAYAPAEPSLMLRVLASVLLMVGALPAIIWVKSERSDVPFMPAIGLIYAMYFAGPIFIRQELTLAYYLRVFFSEGDIRSALALSLIGLLALYAGFYLLPGLRGTAAVSEEPLSVWEGRSAGVFGGLLASVGLAVYILQESVTLPAGLAEVTSLFGSLSILGGLILFVRWRQGLLGTWGVLFLWGVLVPVRTLVGFASGANLQGVELLMALGLAEAAVGRRVQVKAAIVVLALLLFLEPVKAEFRLRELSGLNPGRGVISTGLNYFDSAADAWGQGDLTEKLDIMMSRYGYVFVFARVIDATPDRVPYWGGHTYTALSSKVIPRVLLPGKAVEVTGQAFGHRYRLIEDRDKTTTVNLPVLVEFYANFGSAAVVFGMFLVGMLYRFMIALATRGKGRIGSVVTSAYLVTALLVIENSLSAVLGGALYRLVFLAVVGWGLRVIDPETSTPDARARVPLSQT